MAKKQEVRKPVCGKCMEPINEDEVRNARLLKLDYMHGCGRWLVRGGNAEVPTNHLDDPRYREYWDGERSSPSTGDA